VAELEQQVQTWVIERNDKLAKVDGPFTEAVAHLQAKILLTYPLVINSLLPVMDYR
jgi:hypothetical protein